MKVKTVTGFLFPLVIFCLVALFSSPIYAGDKNITPDNDRTQGARGGLALRGFSDPEMDFQLLRSLGASSGGGGTVGEILVATSDITDGDPSTWPHAFASLAERTEIDGRDRLERGHFVSAREALLRASNYWRAAEYYGDFRNPKTLEHGMKSRQCFLDGIRLFDWVVEDVRIPYKDTFLPGYFLAPQGEGPFPTIAIMSGYDGTAEEMFFGPGRGGLERGWAIMLFEIPGQVGARRFNRNLTFLPDTGEAIRSVIDCTLSRPQVDPERLVLYGASFGGYMVLSGALSEKRLKALIANSPIIDLYEYFAAFGLMRLEEMPEELSLEEITQIPEEYFSPEVKRTLTNFLLRFGQPSFNSLFTYLKQFTVTEHITDITVPTLALVGESEGSIPLEQASFFAENTGGDVTLYVFKQGSGADAHCQMNNLPLSNAVTYDWLEELFEKD